MAHAVGKKHFLILIGVSHLRSIVIGPACQYVTHDERTLLVDAFYHGSLLKSLHTNPAVAVSNGKLLHKDHVQVCEEHPVLATNWIRVCMVANAVKKHLLMQLMHDLRLDIHRSTWSTIMRGEKKLNKISHSLLVVVVLPMLFL